MKYIFFIVLLAMPNLAWAYIDDGINYGGDDSYAAQAQQQYETLDYQAQMQQQMQAQQQEMEIQQREIQQQQQEMNNSNNSPFEMSWPVER